MPTAPGAAKAGGCAPMFIVVFVGIGMGVTFLPEALRVLR
jgi:hypothetical protein